MELNENTLHKIEVLFERTMGDINGGLINKEIASGLKTLGKRPNMQVAPSVKAARREATSRIISNSGAPTVFHKGGR